MRPHVTLRPDRRGVLAIRRGSRPRGFGSGSRESGLGCIPGGHDRPRWSFIERAAAWHESGPRAGHSCSGWDPAASSALTASFVPPVSRCSRTWSCASRTPARRLACRCASSGACRDPRTEGRVAHVAARPFAFRDLLGSGSAGPAILQGYDPRSAPPARVPPHVPLSRRREWVPPEPLVLATGLRAVPIEPLH